jgi:hypothetical protein
MFAWRKERKRRRKICRVDKKETMQWKEESALHKTGSRGRSSERNGGRKYQLTREVLDEYACLQLLTDICGHSPL